MNGGTVAALGRRLQEVFASDQPRRLGLAVSGGSDSRAMLEIAAIWARGRGVALAVATVDHGLRPEAVAEAQAVAARCRQLGIGHVTLRWDEEHRQGNLQAKARDARYRLLADWATWAGIDTVALAHTRDDQAETVLMRLAREAGVDGIAAMPERFVRQGVHFVRPFLRSGRMDLRAALAELGQGWSEDPSNADPTYERVRARHALVALQPLGLTAEALATVAEQMRSVSAALDHYLLELVAEHVGSDSGNLLIGTELFDQPDEMSRRFFALAIRWIGGGDYPPRRQALARFIAACRERRPSNLGGTLARATSQGVLLTRELQAVRDSRVPVGQVWDGRWLVEGPAGEVRALGETGLSGCPNWRDSGRPRQSLLASPSVWRGDELLAAPLAGINDGWTVRLVPDFQTFLISH